MGLPQYTRAKVGALLISISALSVLCNSSLDGCSQHRLSPRAVAQVLVLTPDMAIFLHVTPSCYDEDCIARSRAIQAQNTDCQLCSETGGRGAPSAR